MRLCEEANRFEMQPGQMLDLRDVEGTRVSTSASWNKPLLGLVRYFCELGMKRSAWRDAYRI
jgi:hypothetical protein